MVSLLTHEMVNKVQSVVSVIEGGVITLRNSRLYNYKSHYDYRFD